MFLIPLSMAIMFKYITISSDFVVCKVQMYFRNTVNVLCDIHQHLMTNYRVQGRNKYIKVSILSYLNGNMQSF